MLYRSNTNWRVGWAWWEIDKKTRSDGYLMLWHISLVKSWTLTQIWNRQEQSHLEMLRTLRSYQTSLSQPCLHFIHTHTHTHTHTPRHAHTHTHAHTYRCTQTHVFAHSLTTLRVKVLEDGQAETFCGSVEANFIQFAWSWSYVGQVVNQNLRSKVMSNALKPAYT